MKRLPYVVRTAALLASTYLALRIILFGSSGGQQMFPQGWHFLDPLSLFAAEGERLILSFVAHALLTIGLMWTGVLRARDAGWKRWIGALMLLPVVRLFVFVALAVAPSKQRSSSLELPRLTWLQRILPQSRMGSAVAAVLIALMLVIPMGMLNVRVLEDYGLALFIGLPFLLGALSAWIFGQQAQRTLGQSMGIAMLTVTIAMLSMFVLAMEGVLCIVMAAPIVYGIAAAGALIGHALSQDPARGVHAMVLLVLTAPALMGFESKSGRTEPLFSVITSISIEATPQEVWNSLVAFSRMEEPDELLFVAGISYPIEARIEGTGVGAIRYCQFNTGPFVEPITTWDEPRLLAFDVLDDPPAMTELSIYDHLDAPHVEGYFRSRRGQFELTDQGNGSVLLEGTTWYTHDIWPAWYWRLWSDAILHRIHYRVLDHIKQEAEAV